MCILFSKEAHLNVTKIAFSSKAIVTIWVSEKIFLLKTQAED